MEPNPQIQQIRNGLNILEKYADWTEPVYTDYGDLKVKLVERVSYEDEQILRTNNWTDDSIYFNKEICWIYLLPTT